MKERMVRFLILNPMAERRVPVSEVQACPQFRLDPQHWIPRHKVEDCGGAGEEWNEGLYRYLEREDREAKK